MALAFIAHARATHVLQPKARSDRLKGCSWLCQLVLIAAARDDELGIASRRNIYTDIRGAWAT